MQQTVQVPLQMDTDTVALVLEGLAELPYKRVASVIHNIQQGTAVYLRGMDDAREQAKRAGIEKEIHDAAEKAKKEVTAEAVRKVRKAKRAARAQPAQEP